MRTVKSAGYWILSCPALEVIVDRGPRFQISRQSFPEFIMKKLLSIILSLLLLISLAACSAPNAPPSALPAETSSDASADTSQTDTAIPAVTPVAPQEVPSQLPASPGTAQPGATAGIDAVQPGQQPSTQPSGPIPAERVFLQLDDYTVVKGTILDPRVTFYPAGTTDKQYTLSSSYENVLRQRYGYWTAVGGGAAELIATASNGVTGSVTVNVIVHVESISLNMRDLIIARGDSAALTPIIIPSDATETLAYYTSSDEEVVSVSEDGVIEAISAGTAVVQCTVGGKSASCSVTVGVPVTGISVNISRRTLEIGEQGSFTVQITPQDATDSTFSIDVSGSAVALTGEGTFSCSSSGEATITATSSNGLTARQTVTVVDLVALADEVFRLTNAERGKAGLPALSSMPALTLTAVTRAKETIRSFSHDRPDGRSCFTAFDENYVSYTLAGENIAMGQRTPTEVVSGWMDSPGHRENILNEEFGHLGVGVALDSSGRLYWSQNFTD